MGRQIEHPCFQELAWHRPFCLETVMEVFTQLAASSLHSPMIFEARSVGGKMHYLIGTKQEETGKVVAAFQAHGKVRFHPVPCAARTPVNAACKLRITHPTLSLSTDTTLSTIRAGLAAMAGSSTEMVLQIVLGNASAPAPVPKDLPDPTASWLAVILGNVDTATTEARNNVKEKAGQHNFCCTVRIGSVGQDLAKLRSVITALKLLESVGVRIFTDPEHPDKLNRFHIPWHYPLKLSIKELVSFLLLPIGEEELPGTPGLHPKRTLPPAWYKSPTGKATGRSFALSLDPAPKKLSISPSDSLEHTILLGPTGSGKSTAMQHLILADINAGRSVLVIDPKTDIISNILARIPEERADDVVVLDPTDPSPVGFNPLAFKDYRNPGLVADAILSVFQELWRENWGVRIQDILSAALLTLAKIEGASLLWLPPLLLDERFRKRIVTTVKDKVALIPFWNQFEALSDREKRLQIEPVMNKLRQFLFRPGLRNVLGQAQPKFSLTDLFYQRKIVLVPLNKGLIGAESAKLLGSLIVGLTWTLALSRAELPPERRHIIGVYIDELQDYLSLPTDLADALAQARGLGVSLTLAHQYRDQLPLGVRSAIDANARNKIIFGLSSKDAKDMAAMAPELTAEDFMLLPRYQVYTALQSHGKITGWVMGNTLPPPRATRNAVDLRARSQKKYGIPAEQVEEEYINLVAGVDTGHLGMSNTTIGRRKLT